MSGSTPAPDRKAMLVEARTYYVECIKYHRDAIEDLKYLVAVTNDRIETLKESNHV